MKSFLKSILLVCGVSLTLAAFPVFAQKTESGVAVNKKPLQEVIEYARSKNLDWSKPFAVELEGVLTTDGKFDAQKTKFTRADGDAGLVEIVKKYAWAVSDSGWLVYLNDLEVQKIKMSAVQTSETLSASIILEELPQEKAKTITALLTFLIDGAISQDKDGKKKLGDSERKLLTNTKVAAEEKNVTINISLPASDFQQMIKRELEKAKTTE